MNRCVHVLACLAATVGLLLLTPFSVEAHTEFGSSDPKDGASITEPITMITVTFTKPVTLNGAGFEMLAPDGQIVEPDATSDDGGVTWKLALDAPLASGDVAVRYDVAAEDGHPLTGGFSFLQESDLESSSATVTTPTTLATSTTPSTTASAPSTSEPEAAEPEAAEPEAAEPETAAAPLESDDGQGTLGLLFAGGIAAIAAVGFFLFSRQRAH